MMLVDTSAWIDFFKDRKPISEIVDQALNDNSIAICGPIYTELLRGFKNSRERDKIVPLLQACKFLAQPSDLWETAGQYGFELKRKGITSKTIDLLIVCFATAYSLPLLAADKDFKAMRSAGMNFILIDFQKI